MKKFLLWTGRTLPWHTHTHTHTLTNYNRANMLKHVFSCHKHWFLIVLPNRRIKIYYKGEGLYLLILSPTININFNCFIPFIFPTLSGKCLISRVGIINKCKISVLIFYFWTINASLKLNNIHILNWRLCLCLNYARGLNISEYTINVTWVTMYRTNLNSTIMHRNHWPGLK